MSGADLRYSPEVRRRFLELPAAGDFREDESTVMRASAGDVEQGAKVQLAIRVSAGAVVGARFKAYGCPHFLAAASWLCERLAGTPLADLETWDWREAAAALEIPPAKFGRLLTLQDVVRGLGRMRPDAHLDSV